MGARFTRVWLARLGYGKAVRVLPMYLNHAHAPIS